MTHKLKQTEIMTNLQKARKVSETIKNHLIELGCTLVADADKVSFHVWEVVLPVTDAGRLTISITDSNFCTKENGRMENTVLMFHGMFETPENFPVLFCEYNCINRRSGKWNHYIDIKHEQELTNLLRYFSRIIPILDKSE